MGKTMALATLLVVGVTLLYGLEGAVWMWALSIPIGVVLFIVGAVFGWFK
jgi:type IV secretory pathway VirB2 component (pilin)